jgi:dTDP-4-amino-4,6-dideoxygalactose transaminase
MADIRAQHQAIKSDIDAALKDVMENCRFILGENVKLLESEIAEISGAKYGVGVGSGTDALLLALRALGVGPGDEVITTAFSFVATTEVIALLGATPVFADIDPETFILDPASIESKITRKTKAIVPVHLYGQMADVKAISDIAQRHGLKIVWDGAQAIAAEAFGKPIGTYGDIATLSFFPTKNLGGAGDGGMILTNDDDILEKLHYLRFHGSAGSYSYKYVGYCSRLDEIQAAIIKAKLPYLAAWTDARRANAAIYNSMLQGLPIVLPVEKPSNKHVYHQYTIRCSDRDKLKAFLVTKGVSTGIYYPAPLHLEEAYRDLGYKPGDLPATERTCSEVLSLPIFQGLKKEQVEYVAESIKAFFG